ncbi:MAG: SAM-dependent chlorinase/fluorinase [Oscillospiraceae bacterium]|nr:SAM-dependent chlorinase/fluorinase [Oscillospiraceae bacterium]
MNTVSRRILSLALAALLALGTVSAALADDAAVTRAEAVSALYTAAGAPAAEAAASFADVDEADAATVAWAESTGVVTGYPDGTFLPASAVTREELATMLYRYAAAQGLDTTQGGMGIREVIDYEDISEYALSTVAWALYAGIYTTVDGYISPKDTVSAAALDSMLAAVSALDAAEADVFTGTVDSIAKYGNLELSIPEQSLIDAGYEYGDVLTVTVNGIEYSVPYCTNYSDVDTGSLVLRASDGVLTLAINMGDFATTYGIATKNTAADGSYEWVYAEGVESPVAVSITMSEKGGYYDEWYIRQLERSDERADYAELTDAEFANFRAVTTTGMGTNALYRSSSPVNPEIARNTYADAAASEAGVKTFVNLADTEDVAAAYEGFADSYYATQSVVYLNLGVDFSAEDFRSGLAEGLRFIAANEGPYLVHCNEGKDRAGFVSAVLECFMGATYDEVVADYMTTYCNYYGVTVGSEQYDYIASANIVKSLQAAFGVEDLAAAELGECAETYLLSIGLTADELTALAANLGQDY